MRMHVVSLGVWMWGCGAAPSPPPSGDASVAEDGLDRASDVASMDHGNDLTEDGTGDSSTEGSTGDGSGRTCSFNRECPESERCSCDERTGCRCVPGPRGTGRAGIDRCTSGEECASALCVEANGGVSLCSDECRSTSDCPGALPRCVSVPRVGRFCARDPALTVDASTVDALPGCEGDCARTTLQLAFGSLRGAFERAQHGNDGAERLHVEAHFGGDPACPTPASPTPRRTLVLTGVRATADRTPQTEADGVRATLFDFAGEFVSVPLLRATAVRVVPRAWARDGYVSLEVSASFPGGILTGGVFAPHCSSLDTM